MAPVQPAAPSHQRAKALLLQHISVVRKSGGMLRRNPAMLVASAAPPMSAPDESNPGQPRTHQTRRPTGRYRFVAGRAVDPAEAAPLDPCHPELDGQDLPLQEGISVPESPAQLIAMQNTTTKPRPEKPEPQPNPTVKKVMELLDTLEATPAVDLELAVRLVRRLEGYHDSVVDDLRDDDSASHNQIIAWAVDADRLMRSRLLLESIDLE